MRDESTYSDKKLTKDGYNFGCKPKVKKNPWVKK
jgi:hypothetical protein